MFCARALFHQRYQKSHVHCTPIPDKGDTTAISSSSSLIRFASRPKCQLRFRLVVNRKGSLSAFGRNFRFQLAQKHFSRISLSAERALAAEMLNFGRNITALLAERNLFRPKEGPFGRNSPISAVSAFGRN